MKKEALIRMKDSFEIEAKSITNFLDFVDYNSLEKAVDALSRCTRIATSGCGHSGIACRHFAHSLCCIEQPARFISPAEALHGGMGFVQEGDVFVLASRGGGTDELIPMLQICKAKKVTVIGITENLTSSLAYGSDIVIPMKVERESDKYNSQSTSSFIVLSAIFDALQIAIMEETNYKNEQFALIHPAGSVGKRLNAQ